MRLLCACCMQFFTQVQVLGRGKKKKHTHTPEISFYIKYVLRNFDACPIECELQEIKYLTYENDRSKAQIKEPVCISLNNPSSISINYPSKSEVQILSQKNENQNLFRIMSVKPCQVDTICQNVIIHYNQNQLKNKNKYFRQI